MEKEEKGKRISHREVDRGRGEAKEDNRKRGGWMKRRRGRGQQREKGGWWNRRRGRGQQRQERWMEKEEKGKRTTE